MSRTRVLGLLLVVLGIESMCAAKPSCPKTLDDWRSCEASVEKVLLKQLPSRFKRSGPTLVIRFTTNKEETFVDGRTDRDVETSDRGYVLIDYRPSIDFAVLRRSFWETNTVDLISMKSGTHVEILDAPVFSPDELRFAVVKEDGFRQNSFAVYRVTGDDVTKEFFEENSARSVTALKWLGNDTLSFTESTTDRPRETRRFLKKESGPTTAVTWNIR